MKKKITIIAIIIVLIVVLLELFVPQKWYYLDGGSIAYRSPIYEVTYYNSMDGVRGTVVEIFGKTVYENVYYVIVPR